MGKYTYEIEGEMLEIYPDEEDYEEKLKKAVANFRTFGEAIDEFLLSHGYQGDINDVAAKEAFIKGKCREANCPVPRGIPGWFSGTSSITMKTAHLFAFAFHMNLEDFNDFSRRICLIRGLDCHNASEAVYYYCIRNQLPYSSAVHIISQLPAGSPDGKLPDFSDDILYTTTIRENLDRFSDDKELISYISGNISGFSYNNAKALKTIHQLWERISSPDGDIMQEITLFPQLRDQKSFTEYQGKKVIGVTKNLSEWTTILRILDYDTKDSFLSPKGRSFPFLQDNPLIHAYAADSFPERQALSNAKNYHHLSHERVRKLLILLSFYHFWIQKGLRNVKENPYSTDHLADFYTNSPRYASQCTDTINNYLSDCGYPLLYCGNPYDWIFMFALTTDEPLSEFREFMKMVSNEKRLDGPAANK